MSSFAGIETPQQRRELEAIGAVFSDADIPTLEKVFGRKFATRRELATELLERSRKVERALEAARRNGLAPLAIGELADRQRKLEASLDQQTRLLQAAEQRERRQLAAQYAEEDSRDREAAERVETARRLGLSPGEVL